MANEKTMKFYDAYQELEQIAKDMQDDPEKVIDVMEEKLKRAIELNKFCGDRLGKVQSMLDKYKTESQVTTVDLPASDAVESSRQLPEEDESDIPF